MLNLLADTFVFGNEKFGLSVDAHNPYLSIFGFQIYLYAIVIVTGMCLAILIGGLYFKKRGYDPYDITIYALVIIPIGVLGARAYVYIFPWKGETADWSTFFTGFRNGGLGIYGGVIMGFLAAMVVAKVKKQDFRIVVDSIMPGLFLAQSLGRWGNFFNQEAHGAFITADYNALPNFTEWIFGANHHGFNGYAVWIDAAHVSAYKGEVAGWYQATFFYENVCTLLGFIICVAVLTRSKHYKLGWCSAFYGIFYGAVRLVIESMRTDSLYLYVGSVETDIKISQLVSVFAMLLGVLTLTKIYRKQIHALYKKLFKNDYDEISKSRWILLGVAIALFVTGVTMLVLSGVTKAQAGKGGESYLIAGVVITAVSVYAGLGVWSLFDRLQIYNAATGERTVEPELWQSEREKVFTATVSYGAAMGVLLTFGLFSLIKWGIVDKISNGTVLFVAALGCIAAIALTKYTPALKSLLKLDKSTQPATDTQTQSAVQSQQPAEQDDSENIEQCDQDNICPQLSEGNASKHLTSDNKCHAERSDVVAQSKDLASDNACPQLSEGNASKHLTSDNECHAERSVAESKHLTSDNKCHAERSVAESKHLEANSSANQSIDVADTPNLSASPKGFPIIREGEAPSALNAVSTLTDNECHSERSVAESKNLGISYNLNKFLLFVFPPKTYPDYGVSHLKPYVDEAAQAKKAAKRNKGV